MSCPLVVVVAEKFVEVLRMESWSKGKGQELCMNNSETQLKLNCMREHFSARMEQLTGCRLAAAFLSAFRSLAAVVVFPSQGNRSVEVARHETKEKERRALDACRRLPVGFIVCKCDFSLITSPSSNSSSSITFSASWCAASSSS